MATKKINLLFDATTMAMHLKNGTGTGIYTVSYNVLKELCRRKKFAITLYCEETRLPDLYQGLRRESSEISKLKVLKDKQYNNFDVFFSPMHKIPLYFCQQQHVMKYIILYDIIPNLYPDYFKESGNGWYFKLFDTLNKNDFYFMISKHTQADFIKYNHNVTEKNSVVSYLACDENFKPTKENLHRILRKYHLPENKKYVFSLCTLEPRKNLIRAVKTFVEFIDKHKIDDMVFILGGGHWEIFMEKLQHELDHLGKYKDKILRAGYVDKEDLPTLYSGAEWFVYTSQYEGFGLPPLEAMACGCPVITSNNSSLPEVVGDAGMMIDWDSDEQHIKAYEKYYFDEKYRNEMAQKGLERSKMFSWKKTVDIIEDTIVKRMNRQNQLLKTKAGDKSKINLLYDANLLINGPKRGNVRSGIYFVVYNLLKKIICQSDIKVFLYVTHDNLKDIKQIISLDNDLKNLPFAFEADFPDMDAYLSLHADIPDVILGYGNIHIYKIVYDFTGCIFPDRIFSTKLENHQKTVWCNKLFCISQSTKNDYLKYVPNVDPMKLEVAYLGADEKFHQCAPKDINALKKRLDIKNKYILSVCNLAPHKNLFTAIDAFIEFIGKNKINNLSYVLAGSVPEHFKNSFAEKLKTLGENRDKIVLTGYLEDKDLPVLYSGAEWFVFPSLYEGFGLPILEAMQCGCPVICSNTSSMPEILGDCGILVSPTNRNEFIEAYEKMYKSVNFRNRCRTRGLLRSKNFSWQNTAKNIINIIRKDILVQKDIPVVLHTDNNYVVPAIVTIISMLINKYKNTNYKIYVLGNKLNKENKEIFKSIKGVDVIDHISQFNRFEGTHQHVSSTDLFKFDLPLVFPQYDKILYLDVDMIIQHDLSELYDTDISQYYAAAVKDMHGMISGKHHNRLGLKNYFNAGMMLLNLKKMRQNNISEKLIDYKLHKDQGYFMSQDALNYVFNENVKYIGPQYNYMAPNFQRYTKESIKEFYEMNEADYQYMIQAAHIVHLTDKKKPWKYKSAWGANLWAKYYYMSPLKDKKIKYFDEQKNFRFIGSSERNGERKFFVFGIPLFGTLKAVKKNGNLKIKKYFLGIPYFYKEKAAYKEIYHVLGTEITVWKNLLHKKIEFSKQVNSSTDINGLSIAEKWGRWSCAETVTMMFKLPVDKGDLRFSFNLKPYLNEYHRQQKVSVFVNDSFVAEWTFEYKKAMPKTEFVLPQKMIKKSGKTFVEFRIEHPVSPKDLGLAADARKLGIGFVNMLITPAIVKESKIKKLWRKIFPPKKQEIDYLPEFKALLKEVGSLKSGIDMMQKEIKTLKNEQITIQKMLVDEKVLLQKKRRLK